MELSVEQWATVLEHVQGLVAETTETSSVGVQVRDLETYLNEIQKKWENGLEPE